MDGALQCWSSADAQAVLTVLLQQHCSMDSRTVVGIVRHHCGTIECPQHLYSYIWLLNVFYALSTSCAHGYYLSGNK
jgi:hypothetical protein